MDPELREALDRLLRFTGPGGLHAVADPKDRRARLEDMAQIVAAKRPPAAGVDVEMHEVPGVPEVTLRVHRPSTAVDPLPAVYLIHGGGMVMGAPAHEDGPASVLARDLPCTVVAPTYRLAPEHPYPAALDDVYAGLCWLYEHADLLGVDSARIAVYGRSAGGGLAAAAALRSRDEGGPPIALQVLVYPMLDDREDGLPSRRLPNLGVWDHAANVQAWQWVLAGLEDPPAYAAPARAANLAGLPPAYVEAAELDIFRDEDIHYASALLAQGVSTELHVYAGAYHGFDEVAPDAEVSRRAVAARLASLRNALLM